MGLLVKSNLHGLILGCLNLSFGMAMFAINGLTAETLLKAIAIGALFVIVYYDFTFFHIPISMLVLIVICGVAIGFIVHDWLWRIVSALIFAIPMLVVFITSKFGDVKLIGVGDIVFIGSCGLLLSYPATISGFVLSNAIATLVCYLFRNKIEKLYNNVVPYGAFIGIGYIISIVFCANLNSLWGYIFG